MSNNFKSYTLAAIVAFLVFIFCFSDFAFAQNVLQSRINLGVNLYRNGKKSESLKIFAELYAANRYNYNVVSNYSHILEDMKRDSLLEDVLASYLNKDENLQLRCKYAEVQARSGHFAEAEHSWKIAKSGNNEQAFTEVARSQAVANKYDLAVNTLNEARKSMNDPYFDADEMSEYCIYLNDYQKLTDEILFQFGNNPHSYNAKKYIQTGIIRVTQFKEYFKKEIYKSGMYTNGKKDEKIRILSLMGWFHSLIGEFDTALECYKKYDDLSGSGRGNQVLFYAETLLSDGYYEYALKAYNYLIASDDVSNEILLRALYGNNMALEKMAESGKDFSREEYEKVVAGYRSISNKFSFDKNVVQQAVFREGTIQFEKLGNIPEAIKCFNRFVDNGFKSVLLFNALNELGDIYLFSDSLEIAKRYYSQVFKDGQRVRGAEDAVDYARYELAETEYFSGNIDSAFAMFKDIADDFSKNSANDATEKILFLESNKEQVKAVQSFALAEKYLRQKKYDMAITSFREAIQFGGSDLKENALLKIADVYQAENNPDLQNTVLQEFQTNFPDSYELDLVMYRSGKCLYSLKQGEQAIEILTAMLMKFPRSIYAEKARELIATIRKSANNA